MQRYLASRWTMPWLAVCLLTAFAVFALVSAANLNYATLQGIDGPLNAQQVAALQLSNLLTASSVGILVGVTFLALASFLCRRSNRDAGHEPCR